MVEICNLRDTRMIHAYDVRVDRASVLGNIYYMKDESMRYTVCEKYQKYFLQKIKVDSAFVAELQRLDSIHKKYGKIRLFCWCYPKRCHAEVIAWYLNKQA